MPWRRAGPVMVNECKRLISSVTSPTLMPDAKEKPPRQAASWLLLLNNSKSSRHHTEFTVALERAAGGNHFDRASGCACRNRGGDFRLRDNGERCCRTVKCDAGRPREVRSQNLDGRSHLARRRLRFHKRAQTLRQAEHGAKAVGPAGFGYPVEVPIGGLDQPRVGQF